jgi:hypothetical protein
MTLNFALTKITYFMYQKTVIISLIFTIFSCTKHPLLGMQLFQRNESGLILAT